MKRYKLMIMGIDYNGKGCGWSPWNTYESKERAEQAITDIIAHHQWGYRQFKIVDRIDNSVSFY